MSSALIKISSGVHQMPLHCLDLVISTDTTGSSWLLQNVNSRLSPLIHHIIILLTRTAVTSTKRNGLLKNVGIKIQMLPLRLECSQKLATWLMKRLQCAIVQSPKQIPRKISIYNWFLPISETCLLHNQKTYNFLSANHCDEWKSQQVQQKI